MAFAATDTPHREGIAEVLAKLGAKSDYADARSRRQAAVVAFGRRTIARPALAVLMQDAVALVGEILGADMAGTTEMADHGASIVTTIASIDSRGPITDPVSHQMPMNPAGSMAAFALTMANVVVTSDLPAETAYQDMVLRQLGVRSAMCIPIHLNREPFGALGVYCFEPRQFDEEDTGFAESISHLLAATIARVRAEDEAARHRRFAQSVLDSVDALVVNLDARGYILGMNGASEQLLGVSPAEVQGRPFVATFLGPEAADPFAAFFREILAERNPSGFDVELAAKDGSPRTVRWRGTLLVEPTGNGATVLLSGVDRTEIARLAGELLRDHDREAASGTAAAPAEGDAAEQAAPSPFHPVGHPARGSDMRSSPRRTYQYRQLIAPLLGDRLPARNRFFEVVCEDISAGGISFHLDTRPNFEKVVVALGQPPQLCYFTAQIVRIAERFDKGRRHFLIGCRFTGRIKS